MNSVELELQNKTLNADVDTFKKYKVELKNCMETFIYNPNIFETWKCKLLMYQFLKFWSILFLNAFYF